jgi:triphosphatase
MAIEQELKLALPDAGIAAATAFLTQCAGAAPTPIALENIYFDTPDCALAHTKSAIRLRRTPHGWVQTFKTGGSARDGLHSRDEWEMAVAGPKLEPAPLLAACATHPAALILKLVVPMLQPLFRTDFTRLLWNLQHDGARIEAALDRGAVVVERDQQRRTAPICEIELELQGGSTSALHSLARLLSEAVPGLTPEDTSKAQRGYQLYHG